MNVEQKYDLMNSRVVYETFLEILNRPEKRITCKKGTEYRFYRNFKDLIQKNVI